MCVVSCRVVSCETNARVVRECDHVCFEQQRGSVSGDRSGLCCTGTAPPPHAFAEHWPAVMALTYRSSSNSTIYCIDRADHAAGAGVLLGRTGRLHAAPHLPPLLRVCRHLCRHHRQLHLHRGEISPPAQIVLAIDQQSCVVFRVSRCRARPITSAGPLSWWSTVSSSSASTSTRTRTSPQVPTPWVSAVCALANRLLKCIN